MSTFRKVREILTSENRSSALVLLGFMLVGMALETLGISLVIPASALLMQDDLAARYPAVAPVLAALGNPSPKALIVGSMLTLVSAYVVKAVFLAFLAWRQTRFSAGVRAQVSQRLFTIYLRQPYAFHLQRNSAQLLHNAMNKVGDFGNAINQGMGLIAEGLVLLGIGSLLLLIEPLGTLIVVVALGGAAWGFHYSTRSHIARWGAKHHHHEALRIQHLQQGLGAAKDIKLLGREAEFLAQYGMHNTQSTRARQFQDTLQQLPRLWLELLAVTGMVLLVLTMVAQGRDMVGIVPTLGLFAVSAFRLIPSVTRILGATQVLRYSIPVIDTLHEEFMLAVPEPAARGVGGTAFQHEVRLTDITYTYPDASTPALTSLAIVINKGGSVGIIGPSGSGKSTLVDIILGLLTPTGGRVVVDGQDIQQDLRHWQDQIGYVPQSIYLTDDTFRRNVAFGLPDVRIESAAVERAIRAAQLEEFVASLPDGLETVVGERGIRLSGGQRQRIGIARALYHEPSVLVLDEATSSLDTVTERGVIDAVRALKGDKTVIIVSHRLSTVAHCDRLYRIHGGKVLAEGQPTEMLNTKSVASSARPFST